jgi:hypothetical protein
MADDTTPPATAGDDENTPAQPDPEGGQGTPDDELPDGVRAVLAKERKAARDATKRAAALEAQVRDFEQAQMTEAEKVAARLTEFEARAVAAETRLLRFEVAAERGLDPKFADLLTGGDRDQMEANADRLLELAKAATPTPTAADFDGGARRTEAPAVDMNSFIRDGARRR